MKNSNKTTGLLFILSAIALLIPYTMLTISFEYPDILRQDTGTILTKFYQGGNSLIWTWFAFAITGLPLIPAFLRIGQYYEEEIPMLRIATTIGVIGLIVQMIGLLRWTFVVPVLADSFVNTADEATKAAAIMSFKTIHQYGGVLLGEHLGQLFTIAWTLMISFAFAKMKLMPRWITVLGILSSVVYLLAQAELFATSMKDFPVWDMAGFLGSTGWLIWMIAMGAVLIRKNKNA